MQKWINYIAIGAFVLALFAVARNYAAPALGSFEPYPKKELAFFLVDSQTQITTSTAAAVFTVPTSMNGYKLIGGRCAVAQPGGATNSTTVSVYNQSKMVDLLSTDISIDGGLTSSLKSDVSPVPNTSNNTISVGDIVQLDIDSVSTSTPSGLFCDLTFNR